ncbi:MAG: hypothetical protein WC873_01365 [Candidatus Gracilibacteria bacterium]
MVADSILWALGLSMHDEAMDFSQASDDEVWIVGWFDVSGGFCEAKGSTYVIDWERGKRGCFEGNTEGSFEECGKFLMSCNFQEIFLVAVFWGCLGHAG